MRSEDLNIEAVCLNPSKGGQHVGMFHYEVRVTHKPSGLSATCGFERSQSKNRQVAQSMVEWGLAEIGWRDE